MIVGCFATIFTMKKLGILLGIVIALGSDVAGAATARAMRSGTTSVERTANPISGYTYNYMYPYMNNDMRTALNPGITTSQSTSPINAVVRTEQLSSPRRVVARPTAPGARAATNTATMGAAAAQTGPVNAARAATNMASRNTNTSAPARRVVARSATTATSTRGDNNYLASGAAAAAAGPVQTSNKVSVSASRCLADYVDCMNGYCLREEMAYNRCYCSAKLSQIDSQYKSQIDALIKDIIEIQGTNQWSQAEMNEYWMSVIGKYTGQNSWENLENALNIDWASMESRVRGQQSFAMGHEYCVQNLTNCSYMAGNMRDAYVSQISRDCQTYEQSLQRLKNALESLIGTYND